ncbi:hypothetical protein CLF_112305 [Clonorchis sinensis]|uniref:Uncharacterized protein n=1 Tax=Clonorchis sinensis TaxID=79923 RepID=G7YW58_CLOSI|nr:hypothetical protein CLF_112305 [Clonorchis sinensis]
MINRLYRVRVRRTLCSMNGFHEFGSREMKKLLISVFSTNCVFSYKKAMHFSLVSSENPQEFGLHQPTLADYQVQDDIIPGRTSVGTVDRASGDKEKTEVKNDSHAENIGSQQDSAGNAESGLRRTCPSHCGPRFWISLETCEALLQRSLQPSLHTLLFHCPLQALLVKYFEHSKINILGNPGLTGLLLTNDLSVDICVAQDPRQPNADSCKVGQVVRWTTEANKPCCFFFRDDPLIFPDTVVRIRYHKSYHLSTFVSRRRSGLLVIHRWSIGYATWKYAVWKALVGERWRLSLGCLSLQAELSKQKEKYESALKVLSKQLEQSANVLTGSSVVRTRPLQLDFVCLGLGNLALSSGSMAAGHRKSVTAERLLIPSALIGLYASKFSGMVMALWNARESSQSRNIFVHAKCKAIRRKRKHSEHISGQTIWGSELLATHMRVSDETVIFPNVILVVSKCLFQMQAQSEVQKQRYKELERDQEANRRKSESEKDIRLYGNRKLNEKFNSVPVTLLFKLSCKVHVSSKWSESDYRSVNNIENKESKKNIQRIEIGISKAADFCFTYWMQFTLRNHTVLRAVQFRFKVNERFRVSEVLVVKLTRLQKDEALRVKDNELRQLKYAMGKLAEMQQKPAFSNLERRRNRLNSLVVTACVQYSNVTAYWYPKANDSIITSHDLPCPLAS